jgi:hypothetical protein
MAISRRAFGRLLAAGALACASSARAAASSRYVACRMDAEDAASVAIFDGDGAQIAAADLPARGHDIALRPGSDEAVVFARRPGDWAVVIDTRNCDVIRRVAAPRDRHFYGHGVFDAAGRLLHATENDTTSGNGVIGIYEADAGYRRVGEISSRGIGPHDIARPPESDLLVVANGGLRTLPESGREVLNRGDLRPNIAFIDANRDQAVRVVELALDFRALSIRHLAIAADSTVAFGCQYEGDDGLLRPLVGKVTRDGDPELLAMPELELEAMNEYIGSVALDSTGETLAATSPRGGRVALWRLRTGAFAGLHDLSDVCGVAPAAAGGAFMLTSGNAGICRLTADGALRQAAPPSWAWDNHLRLIDPSSTR